MVQRKNKTGLRNYLELLEYVEINTALCAKLLLHGQNCILE